MSAKKQPKSAKKSGGNKRAPTAWEIYQSLDLGEGGYSAGPSTEVSKTVREILRRKHAKRSSDQG